VKKRLKRLLANLSLSGASLLVCLAVVEIVLRFNGYGNLEIYESDPVLYWKLKPQQHCFTKVDRKPVYINSHGTRGRDFMVPKPPHTLRIVSLGDSKTFGWGLTETETYSSVLEKLLQEKVGANRQVEVINAGVNAWSYYQLNAYFRDYALGYAPDFVLVADANLWTQFSEKNDAAFVKKFRSRVRLKNFLRRFALYHYFVEIKLKDFYARYRTKFIPVDPQQDALFKEQQQKDPGAFFRDNLQSICRLSVSNQVQPVLIYIPTLDELNAAQPSPVLKVKTEVSQELKAPLVDLSADLKSKGKELYLDADPVHLNAAGNALVAQRVFNVLTNLLRP
jgi:lysophospholipase L1-like esterase